MNNEIEELKKKGYYIAYLDCDKCKDLDSFIIQIGLSFKFPDYYGQNLDALDECINDLKWIDEKNYALVLLNHTSFLSNETDELQKEILNILDGVRKEWASVPNYKGEEEFRTKADFVIIKQ